MADEIKPTTPGSTNPPPSSSSPSGLTSIKPSETLPLLQPSSETSAGAAKATEGTASPLTPDIKIPPNLPTGEVKPPESFQVRQPISPLPPIVSQPLNLPPLSPPPVGRPPLIPSAPTKGVKPPTFPPLSSQPEQPPRQTFAPQNLGGQAPSVFKSSIRTMQDDLAALKKGQPPAGFRIEKESEKEIKPLTTEEQKGQETRKISTPPPSISHVELGKLEKAKPITAEVQKGQEIKKTLIPPSAPSIGLAKPSISIPSTNGFFSRLRSSHNFKKIIVYAAVGIVGFVITAYLIPYFASVLTQSVSPTPSATPATSSTVAPVSIESLFSIVDTISIPLGPDFTTRFIDSVITDPLFLLREPGIYKITDVNGIKLYSLTEFVNGISVEIPDELKSLTDENNFLLTLLSKSDNEIGPDDEISFGLIIKLRNPNLINETVTAFQNWENTMKQALTDLLQFERTQAASVEFLDNIYKGTAIRYMNFPDPNLTIDYSIIRAKNGESYLIIVNSREHIYGMIDKLK